MQFQAARSIRAKRGPQQPGVSVRCPTDKTKDPPTSQPLLESAMCKRPLLFAFILFAAAVPAGAQTALTVVSGQPSLEIASLAEAAEIRVRFSEPMVPIGRIPDQVT